MLEADDLDLAGLRLPPMPLITSAPRRTPLQHPDPIVASFQARVAESRDPRLVKLVGNSSSSTATTAAVPLSTTAVAVAPAAAILELVALLAVWLVEPSKQLNMASMIIEN